MYISLIGALCEYKYYLLKWVSNYIHYAKVANNTQVQNGELRLLTASSRGPHGDQITATTWRLCSVSELWLSCEWTVIISILLRSSCELWSPKLLWLCNHFFTATKLRLKWNIPPAEFRSLARPLSCVLAATVFVLLRPLTATISTAIKLRTSTATILIAASSR